MAIFSKAKAKSRARSEQGRQSLLAAKAIEAQEAAEARTIAAEQARGNVYSLLGAPGTYDLPGTAGGGSGVPGTDAYGDVYDTSQGVSSTAKGMLAGKIKYGKWTGNPMADFAQSKRKGILDPEKFAKAASQSAMFRMQSRRTAEAEQLLAQEGPAWDKLEQSTLGQIHEGAAVAMRETMRDLKNKSAKGGTARRAAFAEAQQIRAQQDIAFRRINDTWNANLKLHDYVRQNAEAVKLSNQNFLDNLPGIRDQYTQTMNSLADSLVESTKAASAMSQAGYQARAAVGDSKFWEKLIVGTVGLVASAYGMQSSTFDSLAGDSNLPPGAAGSPGGSRFNLNLGGLLGPGTQNAILEPFTPGTAPTGTQAAAPGVTGGGPRASGMPSGVVGGNL